MSAIIKGYVTLLLNGMTTIDKVPTIYRKEVEKELNNTENETEPNA